MVSSLIGTRTLGHFPLSIGTSLAVQEVLGFKTDENGKVTQVKHQPSRDYREIWINIRTVLRNLLGAIEGDLYHSVSETEMATALVEELSQIQYIFGTYDSTIEPHMYLCQYRDFKREYPAALIRERTTPKQLLYDDYERVVLKEFERLLATTPGAYQQFPSFFTPKSGRDALLVSHHAVDLLGWLHFRKLALLESHTGAIKERFEWSSKFASSRDGVNLPFNRLTLQVFGDSTHFKPQPLGIRRAVLEAAKQFRWTAMTSREMVRNGVSRMANKDISKHLLMLGV